MYIKSIHDITEKYDTFIVDIWGVVHNGHDLFPHVKETLHDLKSLGKEVVFLSNAPRRAKDVALDLQRFGLMPDEYHGIHTSGEDAYLALSSGGGPYDLKSNKCFAFLTSAGHAEMVQDCGLERVGTLEDAALLVNLQPENTGVLTSSDYEKILQDAKDLDLPMVCVNPDVGVMLGDKVHRCAGTLAQYYEKIGGTVHYHGKPFAPVYDSVATQFTQFNKARCLAIGDSLRTDIQGAHKFGIDSLLVLSGLDGPKTRTASNEELDILAQEIIKNEKIKPTYVCSELK